MISLRAMYRLGYMYHAYLVWQQKESEFFGSNHQPKIAIALIPQVLSDTETRINIILYSPDRNHYTYYNLDTVPTDEVEQYITEVIEIYEMETVGIRVIVKAELASELR